VPGHGARGTAEAVRSATLALEGSRCHFTQPANTAFASIVPEHASRGPTSTAAIATSRDPRRHPVRHTPDTPLGRCCNTDPAKHYPGSGASKKG
jgi:hypothetical protein